MTLTAQSVEHGKRNKLKYINNIPGTVPGSTDHSLNFPYRYLKEFYGTRYICPNGTVASVLDVYPGTDSCVPTTVPG